MQAEDLYQNIWQRKVQGQATIPEGSRGAVALSLITTGSKALDIGCGDGTLAVALAARIPSVCGIDISADAVTATIQKGIDAKQVNLDTDSMPFAEGAFDTVTCLDVLEHVFDPRRAARQIAQVCSPGATLVISTPNMRYWRHIKAIIGGSFPLTSMDEEGYDGGHLHYYTAANLRQLIRPWFDVQRVCGIPGAPTHSKSTRLIKLLMPGQKGDEFAYPGIAILARRNTTAVE
ncbi:MAG TPA: class I SAM-dependent methyltransferase [Ktedonobacterales bacterium]|nr:class I SAM-dependent methyltransferase [Ktedonobacterales bacterium]